VRITPLAAACATAAAVLALAVSGCAGPPPATAASAASAQAVSTQAASAARSGSATAPARQAAGTASAAAAPGATIAGCRVGAWADDFTDAGRLAWQVSLPATPGLGYGFTVPSPLAVGGVTVFASGDGLYALRPGDGRQVWRRVFGPAKNPGAGYVSDLYAWHGSVIALLGTDASTPALVSLNAATGAVRWTAALGGRPLELDTFTVTSDGVAVVHTGTQGTTLTAVDLTTGKVRWTRAYAKFPQVQAAGAALVVATKTSGTSPVTLTGLRPRAGTALWSRGGFPNWVSIVAAPGGRVLVDGTNVLPPPPPGQPTIYPVIALSAATGKTLWQVRTPARVTAVWPAQAGVAIATETFDPAFRGRLYLADLATGKVRWSAAAYTDPQTVPVITGGNVTTVEATADTGTVVDHGSRTGAVQWKAVISPQYGRYLAQPAGPNVLVAFPPASASKPSRLLVLDAATGATRATDFLPYTATVRAPLTVAGSHVLLEPEAPSCAVPVVP
jgi:outer membrane protein assembly factor BamB